MSKAVVTKVIFRKYKHNKAIIALFPEVPPFDSKEAFCMSYTPNEGLTFADPHYVIGLTVPASERDYKTLATELQQEGYNLKVCMRCSPKMMRTREHTRAKLSL